MDATATVRIKVVVDVDDVAAMRERLRRACIEALSEDTDDTRIATLEKRVRDLESECEAKSRQIREMEHAKLGAPANASRAENGMDEENRVNANSPRLLRVRTPMPMHVSPSSRRWSAGALAPREEE